MKEVCHLVLYVNRIYELGHKAVGAYIQDNLFRELLLYGYTYGLGQMCLSQSRTSIYEERIESVVTGRL